MNYRILLVDDDKDLLAALEVKLQKEGYQIDTAPDGEVALEKIRVKLWISLLRSFLFWPLVYPSNVGVAGFFLTGRLLLMSRQIENQKTTGKRLRAWRKSVPLKLMQLSRLIKVSQGSLSDLENDKSLPSATTLSNLSIYTDLNIYWLLTGKGPVYRKLAPEMEKSTEQSRLYEDFMFMMQDRKLKGVVEKVIAVYREGDIKKKAQMQGFLSALS